MERSAFGQGVSLRTGRQSQNSSILIMKIVSTIII